MPEFGGLNRDVKCDVAIVGGGMAGLWCGYNLARAGKKVCILEANKIASGVTSGSTAILTYAQDVIYKPLIRKHDIGVANRYLENSREAIADIKNLIETEKIDCEFEAIKFVLFSTKQAGRRALQKEQDVYAELGVSINAVSDPGLPYPVSYALEFDGCYQFNPLKLCAWLANFIVKNDGQIFENTLVQNAPEGTTLRVGDHIATAADFIIATHFPYINKVGFYWLKMHQDQNYAIAFRAHDEFAKGVSYESIDKTGFEYRRVGENILVDGVSVRTGKKQYQSKYRIIQDHIEKHFANVDEVTRFVAQDVITMDKLPYAGRYSHFADNVFVVTGFNKWGMTNARITADVVTDMILGKLPRDAAFSDNIYSPQRLALFVNPIETAAHVGTVTASFVNNLLNIDTKKLERINPGQGAIIKYKGKRIGASRDEDGTIHMISGICPHMGCNLKWNKDERTFDCPCHGSRFDPHGNIINNPATEQCKKCQINRR